MEQGKMKEAQALVEKLKALADSMDMDVEELVAKCCEDEDEPKKMFGEEEEESEDEAGPDRMKVALMVGKMKKGMME